MINPINFIILFGVIQGFILSQVFFFSKQHQRPGRHYLGFFLLILVYNGLETLNWSAQWNSYLFSFYPFTLILGVGPSIYLYMRSLGKQQKITFREILLHYIPVLVQFVICNVIIFYWIVLENKPMAAIIYGWDSFIVEPLSVIIAGGYIFIASKLFHRLKQQKNETNELAPLLQWTGKFLLLTYIVLGLWFLSVFLYYFIPEPAGFSFYYPTEIALVLLMYWMSFTGFHQIYVIQTNQNKKASLLDEMNEDEIQQYLKNLHQIMHDQKPYLDANLNVKKLAQFLSISPKLLSAILNQYEQKGFNEFVNTYRVNEVKRNLLREHNTNLTITGIALESGFNSQATFQRVFKKMEGMTPTEFIATHKK